MSFMVNPYALGAPPWTPAQLSNLEVWLRGDDVTLVSTAVSSWNDKSGNGRHFTEATNRPAIDTLGGPNGTPFVDFDGTNDKLVYTGTLAIASPFTVITVFNAFSATDLDTIWYADNDTAGTAAWRLGWNSTTALRFDANAVSGPSTSYIANTWQMRACVCKAAGAMYTNNGSATSGSGMGTGASDGFSLGCRFSDRFADVGIAEFIVVSNDMPVSFASEWTALKAYLSDRYGIW